MTTTAHPWRHCTPPSADRMTDLDLGTELDRLAAFAACLEAAVRGADEFHPGNEREGVIWLAGDIAMEIGALAKAFEDERQRRIVEEKSKEARS